MADFIYRFGSLQNNLRDPEQFPCVDYVSNDYAIFYTPLNEALPVSLERYPYYSIPGLFTLLDDSAMEASGILAALQTPALSNMGKGVLVGIVDSGIDYTSPAFRNEDGTTRILGIWDQTLPEAPVTRQITACSRLLPIMRRLCGFFSVTKREPITMSS